QAPRAVARRRRRRGAARPPGELPARRARGEVDRRRGALTARHRFNAQSRVSLPSLTASSLIVYFSGVVSAASKRWQPFSFTSTVILYETPGFTPDSLYLPSLMSPLTALSSGPTKLILPSAGLPSSVTTPWTSTAVLSSGFLSSGFLSSGFFGST